ncbi:hypothetical protein D3C75_569670 [compost metagenome]
MRDARVRAQRGHAAAVRRNGAAGVQRAELAQQRQALRVGRGRRRVQPEQRLRGRRAPQRQLQGELRQVGLHNFRHTVIRKTGMLLPAPQPVAYPRRGASCTAPPLVGRCLGHRHRRQPGHARARREYLSPPQTCINYSPYSFDRQAGLGDGSGQDDLAFTRYRSCDRSILLRLRQLPVERTKYRSRRENATLQFTLCAPDFTLAGQKNQHIARLLAKRPADRCGCRLLQLPVSGAWEIKRFYRIGPARAIHYRGSSKHSCDPCAVQRR